MNAAFKIFLFVTVITEEDKFCDRAILDEPVDVSVEENLVVSNLQQPSLAEMPLTDIDTATNIWFDCYVCMRSSFVKWGFYVVK